MNRIYFKIENQKFYSDNNFLKRNSFKVESIPRPYMVYWNKRRNPCEIINKKLSKNSNNLLLIDRNVFKLYGRYLKISKNKLFIAEATEKFKTINGVLSVIKFLQDNKITKGEKLIVVGGGIIQDVGAFVGACYKRGIPWVYMPTTLLSMCDSCIGGKTGINHGNAKNQLALFSAPAEVIINPYFLKTLDEYAIKSGMGEILKLLITGGEYFLKLYRENVNKGDVVSFDSYRTLVLSALTVKKVIVEKDEFELDIRKSLNYGHSLGHVIEVLSRYRIPHGQAVSIGSVVANELSNRKMFLKTDEKIELNRLLFEILDDNVAGIIKHLPLEGLGELLRKDKKTIGNAINFVIIKNAGNTKFIRLTINKSVLSEVCNIIREVFK